MKEFFAEHGKVATHVWSFGMVGLTAGKNPSQRDPKELAEAVHEVLQEGSINLYMFHGGTKLAL